MIAEACRGAASISEACGFLNHRRFLTQANYITLRGNSAKGCAF